jgi:hypothetical protein
VDVKDFHLKTKWFWFLLLNEAGGILAEVFMDSNLYFYKEELAPQLGVSV